MTEDETITLFRPVGTKELALIRESDFREFPPRLFWQPIFYPVLYEEYAAKIARDWNAKSASTDFLGRYTVQTVGSSKHREYWIPAEDLPEFNRNLVGPIEVIAEFHSPPETPGRGEARSS